MQGMNHKEEKNYEKVNMRLSLCLWTLLCGICMSVMLWYAANKTVVIAEVPQDSIGTPEGAIQTEPVEKGTSLPLRQTAASRDSFCILLPEDIRPAGVVVENRYTDRELLIHVESEQTDFFEQHEIYGDVSHILAGFGETLETGFLLRLEMEDVMEYRSSLEGNMLTIVRCDPHEMCDFVVVLDPVGGGSDRGAAGDGIYEKDLALEVALQVQRSFGMSNARLYLTRTEDVEVRPEDRIGLAEAVGADLYIRIGAEADETDSGVYGILGRYNDEYFIPGFGSPEFSDIVTREVTIAASNRAVGLMPVDEDSILRRLGIPAMELSIGYLTNPQEGLLLQQEFYQSTLASGIVNAIQEACGMLEQPEE